jgi:cobalt-zinc-cadmium efflux system membrane fusion protein
LGFLPTVAVTAILALIGLSIVRPDLLPLPSVLKAGHTESSDPAEVDGGIGEAVDQFDDGWATYREGSLGPRELPVIQLKAEGVSARIGLELAKVVRKEVVDTVPGNAETAFNANKYAEIFPRVRGIIREIRGEEGLDCEPGDLLAVVDSAEVGTTKADLLNALSVVELAEETLKRTTALVAKDAAPRSTEIADRAALNRARADVMNDRQRLKNLGFTDEDLDQIARDRDTSSLLRIASPIHGVVVDRHAVPGEAVEATSRLFIVADTKELWAWVDLDESEFNRVRPGQKATFNTPGTSTEPFRGEVEWIDPAVNQATRTIRVRVGLRNPDAILRANQFGTAMIEVGEPREAVLVPRGAVQEFDDEAAIVFLPDGPERYRPQRVVARGSGIPGMLEVDWGLKGGEEVVTTGSFPLLSELKREEIVGE